MARLTGALFSLAASGTIADTLTFAKWKGIQYVRTRVIPANPNSANQQEVRNTFTTLNELWKRMPAIGRAPFIANAAGQPYTARNKHIAASLKLIRDAAAMTAYVWSVPGAQALPPTGFNTVGAAGLVTVNAHALPTAPVGYTFTSRLAAAILNGDPTDSLTLTMYCAESVHASANFNIVSVPAGGYITGGWIKWTRDSDSKVFYSNFLQSTATVT